MLNIHGCSIFSVDVSTGSETVPTLQCTEGRRPPRTGDVSRNSLPSQRRQIVAFSNPCHPLFRKWLAFDLVKSKHKIPWNSQTMVTMVTICHWRPTFFLLAQHLVGPPPTLGSADCTLHPRCFWRCFWWILVTGSQGAWQMSYWYWMNFIEFWWLSTMRYWWWLMMIDDVLWVIDDDSNKEYWWWTMICLLSNEWLIINELLINYDVLWVVDGW